MSILRQLVEQKAQEIVEKKIERENKESLTANNEIKMYNHSWLEKVAEETGFALNDKPQVVENILNKLNERDGHCPCGGMTQDFICPCKMMRTYGQCKCGLWKSYTDINPHGVSDARIKEDK